MGKELFKLTVVGFAVTLAVFAAIATPPGVWGMIMGGGALTLFIVIILAAVAMVFSAIAKHNARERRDLLDRLERGYTNGLGAVVTVAQAGYEVMALTTPQLKALEQGGGYWTEEGTFITPSGREVVVTERK